ncbi:16S rRNA m(7)G-527 methyltransferase [Reichenbachiella faecimaris]|uniref:Ribosomal RNA small subunit methyltransferase G n=1 Tax=Reichenbachiella faecimaris TaxID=692418 RepID=A0A1W2G6M0_REIFA|nr:16S rRNA (guanine(527)-N(7))-methyltransferase RsmG [Reichenbachiella faecimaris]SMD32320.1 16S rRNA m(7)G-527 methyltransferase [Reichenbachiella faecimaris]
MNDKEVIFKYFPDLSSRQQEQIAQLMPLYIDWNAKINVISRKDIEELYIRHVLHSLGIAMVQKFRPGTRILDVGTGGGFPGIPLAILHPETDFLLVDSIGKKIKVVNEVVQALGLTNVRGLHARAEEIEEQFDFIVSRAVTRMKPFYSWIKGKIKKESNHELQNGILYLKGGDLAEELQESKLRYKLYDLPKFFHEDFFDTKKVVHVPRQ